MTQAMTVEALYIFLGWLPPHIVEVLPSLIAVVVVSPLVVSSTKFHWSRSSVRLLSLLLIRAMESSRKR